MLIGPVRAGDVPDPDAELLKEAGLGTAAPDLLALVKQWTGDDTELAAVDELVHQLGSAAFAERTQASARLVRVGPAAVAALLRVQAGPDREAARRATACLKEIDTTWKPPLRWAAVRRLVRLRPAGTVAALLRYLPYAADDNLVEEIYYGVYDLAKADPQAQPILTAALTDRVPARRAAAGVIFGRLGGESQRVAVRKLLNDTDPSVRLRAAQGLLAGKDAAAIPPLIELLDQPAVEIAWSAEELLHWSAGDAGPAEVIGAASAHDRRRCRDAWRAWWQQRGAKLDWERIAADPRRPGLVFVATRKSVVKNGSNVTVDGQLGLCGSDGRQRWQVKLGLVGDVQLLPDNRLLVWDTEFEKPLPQQIEESSVTPRMGANGPRGWPFVRERALSGKLLWQPELPHPEDKPVSCRRLPNGQTAVALGQRGMVGYRPTGAVDFYTRAFPDPGVTTETSLVCLRWLANGRALCSSIFLNGNKSRILECNPKTGQALTRFEVAAIPSGVWALTNGHFLVWSETPGIYLEIDARGQEVRKQPVPVGFAGCLVALRSGGLMIVQKERIREIAADRKVVWERFLVAPAYGMWDCLGLVRLGFDQPRAACLDLATDVPYHIEKLKVEDRVVRRAMIEELAELGPRGVAAAPALIEQLNDPDTLVWGAAQQALRAIGPPALPNLIAATKDSRPRVRYLAIGVLAPLHRHDSKVISIVLKATKDSDSSVRARAIASLRLFGPEPEGVLPTLIGALADPDVRTSSHEWSVSQHAAEVLGEFGPKARKAISPLLKIAERGEWRLRGNTLCALQRIGLDRKVLIPIAQRALEAKDATDPREAMGVRGMAAWVLGEIKPPVIEAIPLLLRVLENKDDDPSVRVSAGNALGKMGPAAKAAIPALTQALRDPLPDIRNQAQWSLKAIERSSESSPNR